MQMDMREFIERAGAARALGVIVTQNGKETARYLWDDACRRNIYSASKSFTSAAVGIALREGLLSLDEKLVDAFEKDLPDTVSPHLEKACVRDLLTMCLGQEKPYLMGSDRPFYTETDWVRAALARPFSDDPGTKFLYSNTGPYLAGMLIQRRAGCDLVHYLMPRLFEPLGIRLPTWEVDPNGLTFGAGGLFLNIDELHLFGQMLLQKGFWKGKQVLPENWVAQSTAKQVENGREGYGYLFWRGKHNSFRADGKYGQYTIVFPDKQAVVTVTAESRKEPAVLETVYDCLVPQF